jgi:hypothetical protein
LRAFNAITHINEVEAMMRASHHKSHFDQPNRVRCRNTKCRSKLPIPTSNDHKAFCTPYCRNQFYFWKCVVCEQPIQKGKRRKQPDHCHRRECRLSFGRYPETYLFAESPPDSPTCDHGSRSAHFTGVKSALKDRRADGWMVIAGPPLSDFSLWAATVHPPKPQKPSGKSWGKPGELAAKWAAYELARRELEGAQYVAKDAERLRTAPVDGSGNYARQVDYVDDGSPWIDWPET